MSVRAAPARRLPRLRGFGLAIPRAAWVCGLVALLNGIAWSLLVPPLQSFDETSHVYYAQFLAETGHVPRPIAGSVLSNDELTVVYGERLFDVVGNLDARPPWTQAAENNVNAALAKHPGRVSQGADGGVGSYPPAFYALGALAYRLTPGGSILNRMALMRIVSALLAALTVVFVYLFVRELLPRTPWVWAVGALVVAFQPLFGFLSGVFNPDNGLDAGAAAMFFLLARGFRRGITPRLALALGLAVAFGFLCQLSMVGLIPGAALGLLWMCRRARSWRSLFAGAAGFGVPVALYCIVNVTVWDRPLLPSATGGVPVAHNLRQMLVYVWQDYLPRLPFMTDTAADYPLWHRYFTGFVGRFGWGDYGFSAWVSYGVLVVLVFALIGAVSLAVRYAAAWRARWMEWLSYAVCAVGLLALLGYTGYGYWRDTGGNGFEQGRYLLPLLALYAGVVAAGVRSLGPRWGRAVGVLIVVLALSQSVWAQLLTVARWYG